MNTEIQELLNQQTLQAINCEGQERKDFMMMFTFRVKMKEVICKAITEQPDDKAMCAVLQ